MLSRTPPESLTHAGVARLCATLGDMDVAEKPTWTYSRRVAHRLAAPVRAP